MGGTSRQTLYLNDCWKHRSDTFLIDGFLASLNWQLGDAQNVYGLLVNEQPIRTSDEASVRYLDYLGLDSEEATPLCIIEAKRPGCPLPETKQSRSDLLPEIIKAALRKPELLKGEWEKWIRDLIDYTKGIFNRCSKWPRRVVITNGEWIIIFEDPENAFSGNTEIVSESILVFSDLRNLGRIGAELFELLAYQNVLNSVEVLTPPQLPFFVPENSIRYVMYGVKATIGSKAGRFKVEPTIYVLPMLFVETVTDGWLRIQQNEYEREIPHQYRDLGSHLAKTRKDTRRLKSMVRKMCNTTPKHRSLRDHYSDKEGFSLRKCVTCGGSDRIELEIMTGTSTHFIRQKPLRDGCPYHNWESCDRERTAALPGPLRQRSVDPKSFFLSGEKHHCSHQTTFQIKRERLTNANMDRVGPRSGKTGSAFCEIFSLDHYLCCQACVFYEICSQSSVFNLPCRHGANIRSRLRSLGGKLVSCYQRLKSRIFIKTQSKTF